MTQIEEYPAGLTQNAAKPPVESGLGLAANCVPQFNMRDGREVTIRPIRSDDESLMAKFHETLSDRTVYMRYFCSLSLKSRVAHERLTRICRADGDGEVALVAERKDQATGQHYILAVGRLMKLDTGNEAEVAVLVSDQYQKLGLGTELLRRVVQIARDQKLLRVRGELLRDNLAMQVVARKLGFRFRLCLDSPSVTAILEL
jgi:acetyltransferase